MFSRIRYMAFLTAVAIIAVLMLGPIKAYPQDKSDIAGATVRFTKNIDYLTCGGASKSNTVKFNGTVNAADDGHVKIRIIEYDDGTYDDKLIDIDIPCNPHLDANTNVIAEVEFKLHCTAECVLCGDNEITVKTLKRADNQANIPYDTPVVTSACDDETGEFIVKVQDVPDDNHEYGKVRVICSDQVPTLSEWGMIIFSLLILTLITVVVARRRTAGVAAGTGADVSISGPMFIPQVFVKTLTVTLGLAAVVLVVAGLLSQSLPLRDIAGTIISAGIIAYMAHLWVQPRRK